MFELMVPTEIQIQIRIAVWTDNAGFKIQI